MSRESKVDDFISYRDIPFFYNANTRCLLPRFEYSFFLSRLFRRKFRFFFHLFPVSSLPSSLGSLNFRLVRFYSLGSFLAVLGSFSYVSRVSFPFDAIIFLFSRINTLRYSRFFVFIIQLARSTASCNSFSQFIPPRSLLILDILSLVSLHRIGHLLFPTFFENPRYGFMEVFSNVLSNTDTTL